MKKLFFILIAMLIAFQATSQEFIKIEWCRLDKNNHWIMHFADGSEIYYYYDDGYHRFCNGKHYRVTTNFKWHESYNPKNGVIWHSGNTYTYEPIVYRDTYTIKKAVTREVNVETQANINGTFSYNSFFAFVTVLGGGGGGKAKGSISGSMRGGTKTVVNIFFGEGKYASIVAADDPIWLEAKPGMKVKHYTVRDTNLYELIIE